MRARQGGHGDLIRLGEGRETAAGQQRVARALGDRGGDLPDLVDGAADAQMMRATVGVGEIGAEHRIGIRLHIGMGHEPEPVERGEIGPGAALGRQEEAEFFAPDLPCRKPGMFGIMADHAQIDLLVKEARKDARLRGGLEMEAEARMRLHERDGLRVEEQRETARAGDPHLARVRVIGTKGIAQGLFFGAAGLAKSAEPFARRGEGETLAVLIDQPLPDLLFQFAQMLRHAWLRHVQTEGRAGEMRLFRQDGEGFEPGGVEHFDNVALGSL